MGRRSSSGRPPLCPPERSRLSHRGSLDTGSRSPTWPSNPGSLPPANGPSPDHQYVWLHAPQLPEHIRCASVCFHGPITHACLACRNGVTAALDPIRGAMRAQPPPVSPFQQAPSWSTGPSQEAPDDALSTAVTLGTAPALRSPPLLRRTKCSSWPTSSLSFLTPCNPQAPRTGRPPGRSRWTAQHWQRRTACPCPRLARATRPWPATAQSSCLPPAANDARLGLLPCTTPPKATRMAAPSLSAFQRACIAPCSMTICCRQASAACL